MVHWHAQVSSELGAAVRGFVAAEQTVSRMQLDAWSRVLPAGHRAVAPVPAAAAAAAAASDGS